jgi:hypothetical protein
MKNFQLASKSSPFTVSDLVFVTTTNRVKSMVGLPQGEKINQVHYRQTRIIDNFRKIILLTTKKKLVGNDKIQNINEAISRFTERIKILYTEIAKFKAASIIDMEPEILNLPSYSEIIRTSDEDPFIELGRISVEDLVDQEIMERILLENNQLFTRFMAQVLIQGTEETVVPLLNKTATSHGYKLVKIKETVNH